MKIAALQTGTANSYLAALTDKASLDLSTV
jgi:hypothetical protein